jgi:hypothetical protein
MKPEKRAYIVPGIRSLRELADAFIRSAVLQIAEDRLRSSTLEFRS